MKRKEVDRLINKAYGKYLEEFSKDKKKYRDMGFDVSSYHGYSSLEFHSLANERLKSIITDSNGKLLFGEIKINENTINTKLENVITKAIREDFFDYSEKQIEGIEENIKDVNEQYGTDFAIEEFKKPGFIRSDRGQLFYNLALEFYHEKRANGEDSYKARAAVSALFFGSK